MTCNFTGMYGENNFILKNALAVQINPIVVPMATHQGEFEPGLCPGNKVFAT